MIEKGQELPESSLSQRTKDGLVTHHVRELFANKKAVLFAVPGHLHRHVQIFIYQVMLL